VKRIVLFASCDIPAGEEITYDYDLPLEDVKVVCTCNAKNCRGFLN
jgi:SET domain-containing protein